MRVIVAGSRDLPDTARLRVGLAIQCSGFYVSEIVSGGCRGVDTWAESWAEQNKIPVVSFPADWGRYGKSAGPIRNKAMANFADALIAIWDGRSPGTKNMIRSARKLKLKVYVELVDVRSRKATT